MELTRDALEYIAGLGKQEEKTEVVEICGHTYANRNLKRYDVEEKADPIMASTLSSMVQYILNGTDTLNQRILIHVQSPTKVKLMSELNWDREREVLFISEAETSDFRFDTGYSQERFVIEMQANFVDTDDRNAILRVAGNVEAGTQKNYGDDGISQKVTVSQGIASKVDALVPNPVFLRPYRTFIEVEQPGSPFVFRIGKGRNDEPEFRLIEAGGGLWKNEAIKNIIDYFQKNLSGCPYDFVILG